MTLKSDVFHDLLRKPHSLYGRLISWAEFSKLSLDLPSGRLSHGERMILLRFRPALITRPRVVFDIGASIGNFASVFSKLAFVEQVIAFEPLPSSFSELEHKAAQCPRIRPFQVALGNENREQTFYESSFRDSSSALPMAKTHKVEFPFSADLTPLSVTGRRLDDFVQEHGIPQPDFVKIDVQGFEDRVLSGGEVTIRKAQQVALEMSFVELYEGSLLFEDVYSMMKDLGFKMSGVLGSTSSGEGKILQIDAIFDRS